MGLNGMGTSAEVDTGCANVVAGENVAAVAQLAGRVPVDGPASELFRACLCCCC